MSEHISEGKKVMLYIPFMKFNPLHHLKDQGGIANAFTKIGWETTLVIGQTMGNMSELNSEIYLTNNTTINNTSTHFQEILQFIRILKRARPKILLMWNVGFMPSIVGLVLKFYFPFIKYKPEVSILRLDWDGLRKKHHFPRDLMFYLNLKMANLFFDFVTTETTCGRKRIASLLPKPDKLSVVPVGIGELKVKKEETPIKKERILLSIARIARYKNIDGMVAVFAKLADKYPDWQLYVIGLVEDKEYFEEIRSFVTSSGIDGRVHFLGELPYEKVDEWRNKAPIFVTLSKTESFNLARYEAIAHGMTVISSPAGCVEDFGGIVVAKDEKEALNSICAAIEKFESSGGEVSKSAISVNTWEDVARMFIELGHRIIPIRD